MLRIDRLTNQREQNRNSRAVQGSSGDAPEHEAIPEDDSSKLRDSLLVNDDRWIEYVE